MGCSGLAHLTQGAFDVLLIDGSWIRPHNTIFDTAVLEQHYCRDAHYFISGRYFLVGVDVDLDELDFACELVREGFNRRSYRMTWSAPVCVEIYENWDAGFENFGVELTVVKADYFSVSRFFGHHRIQHGPDRI